MNVVELILFPYIIITGICISIVVIVGMINAKLVKKEKENSITNCPNCGYPFLMKDKEHDT